MTTTLTRLLVGSTILIAGAISSAAASAAHVAGPRLPSLGYGQQLTWLVGLASVPLTMASATATTTTDAPTAVNIDLELYGTSQTTSSVSSSSSLSLDGDDEEKAIAGINADAPPSLAAGGLRGGPVVTTRMMTSAKTKTTTSTKTKSDASHGSGTKSSKEVSAPPMSTRLKSNKTPSSHGDAKSSSHSRSKAYSSEGSTRPGSSSGSSSVANITPLHGGPIPANIEPVVSPNISPVKKPKSGSTGEDSIRMGGPGPSHKTKEDKDMTRDFVNDDIRDDQCEEECNRRQLAAGHGRGRHGEHHGGKNGKHHGGKKTSTKTKSTDKPDCCKGGVSALQLLYFGEESTLHSPDSPDLGTLQIIGCDEDDAKNSKSKSKTNRSRGKDANADTTIVFVNCECIVDSEVTCQPSFTVDVSSGTEICIASVDASGTPALDVKFPMDLGFYLSADGVTASVSYLHTSCSQPIYPPYAFTLDTCSDDDENFYVDLSESTAMEPYLEFIDGISARDPSVSFKTCVEPAILDCDCGGDGPNGGEPTGAPTVNRTAGPTDGPTPSPTTPSPTDDPTPSPTTPAPVSANPTAAPVTTDPTAAPVTGSPTTSPVADTASPVSVPLTTDEPTLSPTAESTSGATETGPIRGPEANPPPGGNTGESLDDSRDGFLPIGEEEDELEDDHCAISCSLECEQVGASKGGKGGYGKGGAGKASKSAKSGKGPGYSGKGGKGKGHGESFGDSRDGVLPTGTEADGVDAWTGKGKGRARGLKGSKSPAGKGKGHSVRTCPICLCSEEPTPFPSASPTAGPTEAPTLEPSAEIAEAAAAVVPQDGIEVGGKVGKGGKGATKTGRGKSSNKEADLAPSDSDTNLDLVSCGGARAFAEEYCVFAGTSDPCAIGDGRNLRELISGNERAQQLYDNLMDLLV